MLSVFKTGVRLDAARFSKWGKVGCCPFLKSMFLLLFCPSKFVVLFFFAQLSLDNAQLHVMVNAVQFMSLLPLYFALACVRDMCRIIIVVVEVIVLCSCLF